MTLSFSMRLFWVTFAVHVGLVLSCLINLHLEPIKNIHLTTQRDAVLIYGTNELGLDSIRIFKNWNEMDSYIKQHHLALPKLSFAEQGSDLNAILLKSKTEAKPYYRIFWINSSQQQNAITTVSLFNSPVQQSEKLEHPDLKMVIHTPDPVSALEMLNYVKYFKLRPSVMGYSIPVYPENELSI
jgi:hypothetical protein